MPLKISFLLQGLGRVEAGGASMVVKKFYTCVKYLYTYAINVFPAMCKNIKKEELKRVPPAI